MEFIDRVVMMGLVEVPNEISKFQLYQAKHRPASWPYINPLQDVQADALKVDSGFTSRTAVVAERNDDENAIQVDQQRQADSIREAEFGLTDVGDGSGVDG